MNRRKSLGVLALVVVLVLPALALTKDKTTETYRQLDLFGTVFERVRANYVEQVTDEELIEAAIKGMLTSLDPHSSFLDAKNFREMQVQTRGEFGGLGIEVTMEGGYVKVISPIDETPAHRAGIQPGDLITHLNGETIQGLSLSQAVERMRGKVDTDIKLSIRREGREPFDLTITRAIIRIQSVRSRTEGKVGYIRITTFTEQTTEGLKKALKKIDKEIGKDLLGYVIDLRNNPGGLLDQAISVADTFMDKGEIVSTRGRHEQDSQRWNAKKGDDTHGLPLVVLINGGSASASEIVAGALQDHRRAIIMGTKSFGKGSVQTIIPLGGSGAMRLTTSRYFTPRGRSIQATGIEPDIEVEPARIEPIESNRGRRESDLRGALSNPDESRRRGDEKPADDKKPAPDAGAKNTAPAGASAGAAADTPKTPVDYQLARALDLLRGVALFNGKVVN